MTQTIVNSSNGGATFERRNPMTGAVVTTMPAATAADARAACDRAAAAFAGWAALGPGERRGLLLRAADELERVSADFVGLMLAEAGMTAPWAGFNVHLAAGILREAASLTTRFVSRPASSSGSRLGTRRSSSACARWRRRWRAGIPSS